jgi:hypothetical protein
METDLFYHVLMGVNVVLLAGGLLAVFSWPRSRARLVLCASLVLLVAPQLGWWGWSLVVASETWGRFDRYSPLVEVAAMASGILGIGGLLLFAVLMRAELARLREAAGPAGAARRTSSPRESESI